MTPDQSLPPNRQEEVKQTTDRGLRVIRTQGPSHAQEAEDKWHKTVNLPNLKKESQIDRLRLQVRQRVLGQGDIVNERFREQYHLLTPEEERRMSDIKAQKVPPANSPAFKGLRPHVEQGETRRQAANLLGAAGVRSLEPEHKSLAKVIPTPRQNPSPWQDPEKRNFLASDWKLREAKEVAHVRKNQKKWPDLRAEETPPAEQAVDSAAQIRGRRAGLQLPRSLSDKTHMTFDRNRGAPAVDDEKAVDGAMRWETGIGAARRRLSEGAYRWGVPSSGTRQIKQRAFFRAHSIGYPGEVSHDNAASTMAGPVLRDQIMRNPRGGWYVPRVDAHRDLIPHGEHE